ncbi:MAG: YfhO family protein [bacterium]|nr:YfhO family protein [bacterium]
MRHGGEGTGHEHAVPPGGRRAAAVALAVSALLVVWAWRDLLSGEHSPFTSDIRHYHHAVTRALADALAQGRLALWTDHTFFGFPLFADPQVAAFYPGTWLVAACGPHTGYVIFLLLHAWIAAAGMLGLARSFGASWPSAFAAGMLVSLSGYFAHEAQHPGLFAILCWMPWWLWATRVAIARPSARARVAIALVVAAMLFAGTLQVLFGALVLYAFYLVGLAGKRHSSFVSLAALQSVVDVGLANALGLALAAIVVVPAVAHLPLTARALGMTYEFAAMGSVHPQDFLGLFLNSYSSFSGVSGDLDYRGLSFFIGTLTLPLAIVGAFALPRRLALALGGGALLLVWLAMGRHAGLHPWLYEWMPGAVGGLRGMGRALGPLVVVLALWVALGVDRVARSDDRVRMRVAVLVAGWLVAVAIAIGVSAESVPFAAWGSFGFGVLGLAVVLVVGRVAAHHLPVALAVVLVGDLLIFGALRGVLSAYPPPPNDRAFPDAVTELAAISAPQQSRLMLHGFGPLNLPMLNGVDGVGGYNPLVTLQYLDFVQLINDGRLFPRGPIDRFVSGAKPQRFTSPLFDAASVAHVVSSRHDAVQGLARSETYTQGALAASQAALYENPRALPRAYLAYRTVRAASSENLERLLAGRGFDAHEVTVVEGAGPRLSGPAEIVSVKREGSRPEHRVFAFPTQQPAVLVVTDSWYPGWQATVDGESAPLFRVNGMFRGVSVPAGTRRVEMRFVPPALRVGALISGAAVVVTLLILGRGWRRVIRAPRDRAAVPTRPGA